MEPLAILRDLVAGGGNFTVEGDRLVYQGPDLPQPMRDAIAANKSAIIAMLTPPAGVAWRADAMGRNVPTSGPVPLLVAVEGLSPTLGRCFSCYAVLRFEPTMRFGRCTDCALAAAEVVKAELATHTRAQRATCETG
jgi:hypothetical protein